MSYIPPIDTSPDAPTTDSEGSLGGHGFQTTAALPSTLSATQNPITPTSSTHVPHEDSSSNSSTRPSPSSNRSRQRLFPAEGQEGAAPVAFAPSHYNENSVEASSALASYNHDNLRRLAEAQQQPPVQTTVSDLANISIPRGGSSTAISLAGRLESRFEELRKIQGELQINTNGPWRTPVQSDFPPAISMKIFPPSQPVETCIILMYNIANNEASTEHHIQTLKRSQPESVFILLQCLQPFELGHSGYPWTDADSTEDEEFIKITKVILRDIVQDGLMAKCGFQPQDIVILGHGQAGTVALAATACWNCIEFGGVVLFGGPMPGYLQMPLNVRAKTPVLIYGVARGDITHTALQQIQNTFSFVDHHIQPSEHDTVPGSGEEIAPLLEFFAHRFRREEWKRQAVISLDGGGIRGYGTLLILRDLMNKIGDLEKVTDATTESSFSPCDYKPTVKTTNPGGESGHSRPPESAEPDVGEIGPTISCGLPNSALFLPCHYFTYAAGSSTGGLISIMLSRFRMTVEDCIEEYKTLGKKIFEQPRPMTKGGFPWPKYNARVLEDVIRGVTSRHNKQGVFGDHYGMEGIDGDRCQWCVASNLQRTRPIDAINAIDMSSIVLAYADHVGAESPYVFRTYGNQALPRDSRKSQNRQPPFRNPGGPSMLPIWQVARATSAAPGYFAPIQVQTGNGAERITFKDGGFGTNNPSEEAYWDILKKHGGIMHMGPFISIGTGKTPLDMFGKRSDNLSIAITNVKTAIKLASRTFKAHENMLRNANPDGDERFPYFRFEGGPTLGKVDLGEWKSHRLTLVTGKDGTSGRKTLEKIESAIEVYLRNPEVQRDLMECAKLLVDRRRLRIRNASKWDRYASYSHYVCNINGCPQRQSNTADDFKAHLRAYHKYKPFDQATEKRTLECRRVQWLYRPEDTAQESIARKNKGKGRT